MYGYKVSQSFAVRAAIIVFTLLASTFVLAGTQESASAQACAQVQTYEVTDGAGNPVSSMARIYIDAETGTVTQDVDLSARLTETSNTFFVDETVAVSGNGTPGNEFKDFPDAVNALRDAGIRSATIRIAAGNYTWGDLGALGFNANVIGEGADMTFVNHTGTNVTAAQVRGRTIYIEGITFSGGSAALDIRNSTDVTLRSVHAIDSTGNGFNIYNANNVLIWKARAFNNFSDGFNYKNPALAPMEVLEIRAQGADNGLNGEFNSQGSTAHGTVKIVRVGSVMIRNPTNISDVGDVRSWNIGVRTADAQLGVQNNEFLNYNITGNVKGWIIGGSHGIGSNQPVVIHSRDLSELRYTPEFGGLNGATQTGNPAIADSSPLVVSECMVEQTGTCNDLPVTVFAVAGTPTDGTAGPDVILGTEGDDVINGLAGDDVVCGLGGNDTIILADGNDIALGGEGNDTIFGQAGDDMIWGNGGDDKVRSGDGNDKVYGGDGVDDLAGGRDNDEVYGEAGDDAVVRGNTGDDIVDGGTGNDPLVAGNGGEDMVNGGDGDDKVTGGPRPDTVDGGAGNDEVKGNGGGDTINGGAGDDMLFGGKQPDVLDGGPGTDTCNGGTTGGDPAAVESDVANDCEGTETAIP